MATVPSPAEEERPENTKMEMMTEDKGHGEVIGNNELFIYNIYVTDVIFGYRYIRPPATGAVDTAIVLLQIYS